MDALHWLPFISTLITVVFAFAVFRRYFTHHRHAHLLLWGLGLALYALGTLAEAYLAVAWSPVLLRLWYLSGAMLTAAWLGQGTVYLLVRRRGLANALMGVLLVASLVAVAAVFMAPIHAEAFQVGQAVSSQYKAVMDRTGLMILLTILLNIYGTLTLIGGAVWSAWLFFRKHILLNRVLGNVLIAAGALLPAGAGTFIRLGLGDWLYVSELLGAALMFLGFWLATQSHPAEKRTLTARAA
jgi:hypothetical protein